MSGSPFTNRLADETSPYLLQHAHNPVDWYPWGEEALEKARAGDKPILLSIGYAACHWCHVMERESFENEEIAALMNDGFVCIKVDREERPDIDDIYMTAVQMMTGHGGWPLTIFLTPDLKPFFGGTYFPPDGRLGMPGFRTVLDSVARSYREQRGRVDAVSTELAEQLQGARPGPGTLELLTSDLIHAAVVHFRRRFDPAFGGFSPAPKFPPSMAIGLLLRYVHHHGDEGVLHMVRLTLERMAYGGIYDQLGGGFHRYSTDDRWLAPHFEKMLYDNALLAIAYLEAFQLTGDDEIRRVASETLDWVIRDMQSPEGGYYSTLDADSEGEEGKFYVWSQDEIAALLGDDAEVFSSIYDVTDAGNFEGSNILNLKKPLAESADDLGVDCDELIEKLKEARRRLLERRNARVWPGLDDKILADWNGLMIVAMARGYRVLGEPRYLESARSAADFFFDEMIDDGRLLHSYRDGKARFLAYSDDYANLMWAAIELYESTFESEWLRRARQLADGLIELFVNEEGGGFFFTGTDHEQLIARMQPGHDGATPSGNSVAATALQRLQTLTGEESYGRRAVAVIHAFQAQATRAPTGFPQMLAALDYYLREPREIVVVGPSEETRGALSSLWQQYAPNDVIVAVDPGDEDAATGAAELPLLEEKEMREGRPTFYLCENYACRAPTNDLDEILTARSG